MSWECYDHWRLLNAIKSRDPPHTHAVVSISLGDWDPSGQPDRAITQLSVMVARIASSKPYFSIANVSNPHVRSTSSGISRNSYTIISKLSSTIPQFVILEPFLLLDGPELDTPVRKAFLESNLRLDREQL